MPDFIADDGVRVWYEVEGAGARTVLALHSYPFDSRVWEDTPILARLLASGWTVVRPDARGRGRSDRPTDPARYSGNAMTRDVQALATHLGTDRFDVVAYSQGAHIALRLLQTETRLRKVVLGGVGNNVPSIVAAGVQRAADLSGEDESRLSPAAHSDRARIIRLGADRAALAAMWLGPYLDLDLGFADVRAQVLIVNGRRDTWIGDGAALAAQIPHAQLQTIEADHVTALSSDEFADRAIAFLSH